MKIDSSKKAIELVLSYCGNKPHPFMLREGLSRIRSRDRSPAKGTYLLLSEDKGGDLPSLSVGHCSMRRETVSVPMEELGLEPGDLPVTVFNFGARSVWVAKAMDQPAEASFVPGVESAE